MLNKSPNLRLRFWLETAGATITGVLLVLTLVWKDWIEVIFGVDPDSGNGSLEWSIVGVMLVLTIVFCTSATYEWRRTQKISV